jgi:hypothetical protein
MWASALVIAALGVAGCAGPNECATNVPPKSVENFFSFWSRLAPDIKRVVVLPIACDPQRPELLDGCTLLQPILETELTKTGRFEVVPANAESLCIRTGSDFWTGSEVLPNDFLTGLREQYGCDAVLFCQLTEFRSYSPLAVGWRMRLVEVRSRQTLWAVDEMFDGGNASVLSGATQYQAAEEGPVSKRSGHWPISVSPRRFAQYAAAQILATLPER